MKLTLWIFMYLCTLYSVLLIWDTKIQRWQRFYYEGVRAVFVVTESVGMQLLFETRTIVVV